MALLAIPNVSEGRNRPLLRRLSASITATGAHVLDVHADSHHNRSVFTATAATHELIAGMVALAVEVVDSLDLSEHSGVHPRLGLMDVCPFVPHGVPMVEAVEAARRAASSIAIEAGLPTYLYGAAAEDGARDLPSLRRGGLEGLIASGLTPDFGPIDIDPHRGVVCVGARGVLIAFNVWLEADEAIARAIATRIRTTGGGPPGLRALGVPLGKSRSQVTMNLIDPGATGIDAAFGLVEKEAAREGAEIVGTEIVGLVPERFMPDPDARAARLLLEPGRSLESVLEGLLAPPG